MHKEGQTDREEERETPKQAPLCQHRAQEGLDLQPPPPPPTTTAAAAAAATAAAAAAAASEVHKTQ